METRAVAWDAGTWSTAPEAVARDGDDLLVTSRPESDLWRTTSYGFVHDDGHGLLVDLHDGTAVEVSFLADFDQQFDQAGVLVRADERHWVKAGVEYADGAPQVGAVVTRDVSDWSTSPHPEWHGREVTVRVSRSGDALTVRARTDGPWQLVRLAPIDPTLPWRAGPFTCAPTRAGLVVRFTRFAVGPADSSLHD
jgi:regulation of enolase protein 1 (concanavalin A-like superfamily)